MTGWRESPEGRMVLQAPEEPGYFPDHARPRHSPQSQVSRSRQERILPRLRSCDSAPP